MTANEKKQSKKAGLPPGSLIHVGKHRTDKIKISVIDYTNKEYSKIECNSPEETFPFRDKPSNSWINIDGVHQPEIVDAIGNHFGLHHLLIEDILNTNHRPKTEEFENCIFCTFKMLSINKDEESISKEQVSVILGKNWVVSFQEQEGDIFDGVRKRIKDDTGLVRKLGSDYLLYRLIDTVVDNYFIVAEYFGEATAKLEEEVLEDSGTETLQEIQRLKRMLISFRKSVLPLREAINNLQKEDNVFITKNTTRYMKDVYEHLIQLSDTIETNRDMLANIMDLYLSGVSNKMNKTMQVLTIIATIFIPLTFIAGIYGMNFDNMPELHWKYGYLGVWIIMIVTIVIMINYFRKKDWL